MGVLRVSPALALGCTAVGLALLVAAAVWLCGPWGLLAAGFVLVLVGLLVPVRERHGEPSVDLPAPD